MGKQFSLHGSFIFTVCCTLLYSTLLYSSRHQYPIRLHYILYTSYAIPTPATEKNAFPTSLLEDLRLGLLDMRLVVALLIAYRTPPLVSLPLAAVPDQEFGQSMGH